MKSKLGTLFIILGCALMAAALVLFLHNQKEQVQAAAASQEAIPKVVEAIRERKQQEPETTHSTEPTAMVIPEMTVVDIDGYGYIGFLGIPSLELELPVMTDWTYPQLQIAPCRYFGSTFTDDLVVMAHNYPKHFGKLRDLQIGQTITFTDMDGNTTEYEVVALDIMDAEAVEDMTSGEYDLTLFTCNYGGQNRITVRCDKTME